MIVLAHINWKNPNGQVLHHSNIIADGVVLSLLTMQIFVISFHGPNWDIYQKKIIY